MLRVYRLGRDIVDCRVMHRLRELRPRKDHDDRHLARLTRPGTAEDLQPVVVSARCPPGGARIEVDGGGRMADGIEGTGIPARPWANVLGNLMREDEAEVCLAECRSGYSLNLLQHPRAQVNVSGGTGRGECLPRPAEPDARQMDVDADEVQGRRERDQRHVGNRPAEYQAYRHQEGSPLDPARHAAAAWAPIASPPAGILKGGAAGRRIPRWQRPGLAWPARAVSGPLRLRVQGAWRCPSVRIADSVPGRFRLPRPVCGERAQQKEQQANHAVHLFLCFARVTRRWPGNGGPARWARPRRACGSGRLACPVYSAHLCWASACEYAGRSGLPPSRGIPSRTCGAA